MNNTFRQFAETAQTILETRGKNTKINCAANYLGSIETECDLHIAAQYFGEGAFSNVSGKRTSVGHRTIVVLAAEFCEIDYDLVFKPCRTATGSASETIQKLMNNMPQARAKWTNSELPLLKIAEVYEQLFITSKRDLKQQIIKDVWSKMTPLEVKFFIRIMGQGSLRIGFETRSVVSAIAKAFDQETEKVRYAHMITGSLGKTAVLAKNDRLHEATFELFHPLSFMLASPIESSSVDNFDQYIAEEKFDGMRCQIHISGNNIALFSRDLNEITGSFPEIVEFFLAKNLPNTVLDGEICVFKDNTILPFQLLQKRMGVKKPTQELLDQYPVLFVAYDLIYHQEQTLFEMPLSMRRAKLEYLADSYHLPITSQMKINSLSDVEALFDQAIGHGNEGLMLKKLVSTYEYGQRRNSWLKVKKPSGTLDVAILYAHSGSGKRGGTYSDFTLGISVKDDERYEEEFIPIGKAYGGYTNEELAELNRRVKDLTLERFGPTLLLKPALMVELEFEDIQINKRTKANYTLRFPRFKAIRWDLSPTDANTLNDVEKMYQEKLNQVRKSQDRNPSFIWL